MSYFIKKDKINGLYRVIMYLYIINFIVLIFILFFEGKVFIRELWEMVIECLVVFLEGIGIVFWMVLGGIEIVKVI